MFTDNQLQYTILYAVLVHYCSDIIVINIGHCLPHSHMPVGLLSARTGHKWSTAGRKWSAAGREWSAPARKWSAAGRKWTTAGLKWSAVGRKWSATGC